MEQRDTFDAVAGLYASARPAYPAAMFDDLAALGALTPTARVLEVDSEVRATRRRPRNRR